MKLRFLFNRLKEGRIWRRLWRERLCEPLHVNLISMFVAVFGSFRLKADYDLIVRPQHAYGLLSAADKARRLGIKKLMALEFGVANGTGLMNIALLAEQVTRATGVEFEVVGFDSGSGMPPPRDVRDHPEHYQRGDYVMENRSKLLSMLPANARILFGDFCETIPCFMKQATTSIGFISFDCDYYCSTMDALKILKGPVNLYMAWVLLYFDDVQFETHNRFAGQLLAIEDFNRDSENRKIDRIHFLPHTRIFARVPWVHQMYMAHVFDHPYRREKLNERGGVVLANPYM